MSKVEMAKMYLEDVNNWVRRRPTTVILGFVGLMALLQWWL